MTSREGRKYTEDELTLQQINNKGLQFARRVTTATSKRRVAPKGTSMGEI